MTKSTVKLKLRASERMPESGTLVFHCCRHRITKTTTTPYMLGKDEWDKKNQRVVTPKNAATKRKKELSAIRSKLKKELQELQETIEILESRGDYSSGELVTLFRNRQQGQLFCAYVYKVFEKLMAKGKFGTAFTYKYAANSFMKFLSGKDIPAGKIDNGLMKAYEHHLLTLGCKKNSVSCYMRTLRAAYNTGVNENVFAAKDNLFSGVFTGNAKTQKRAAGVDSINKITHLDLPESLQFARDLFLFSLYTQGMSHIDVLNLKKENIQGNIILYYRQKTGQPITIQMEACIKQIIDRYEDPESDYIFPVLRGISNNLEKWQKAKTALSTHNRLLKQIGALAGTSENLTSYVPRHSWASIAAKEGIPMETISRGMGHESEKTTRIYISRTGYSDVAQANRKILFLLLGEISPTAINLLL